MRVVHIIPSLNRGGAERFVVDLCNALVDQIEVHIISLYSNQLNDTFIGDLSHKISYYELQKKSGFDFATLRKLNRVIKRINPDVVHTHLNAFEYILLQSLKQKYLYFHTVHNDAVIEAGSRLRSFLRKFFFSKKLITPITISNESRKSFIKAYGRSDIDRLIFNGAIKHMSKESKSIREKLLGNRTGNVFLNVARINPQKNQVALAKAFSQFNSKCDYQHVLVILGEVQSENIISELQGLCIESLIILGSKSNVGDYYESADVFVLSSIYEGLPISLLESMAFGCVPISTPVGGVRDLIVDGQNGLLATGTSAEEILNAFERFCTLDDQEVERIRENAKNDYQRLYSIELCSGRYLNEYKKG